MDVDDWVVWVGIIKKSKSFDGLLFVVVVVVGFIAWRRSFDVVVVVCWNDSNGSNGIDEGGAADEVGAVVGQIEGCDLKINI